MAHFRFNKVAHLYIDIYIYHKSVQMYLEETGESYIILNPLEAAKIRKSQLRATKNDKKDCKNIASAYFLRDFKLHNKQDVIYEELQQMNRFYGFMVQQNRMIKVQFRNMLDVVYPNFDKLYSDIYSNIPITLLKLYSHPNKVNRVRLDTLAKNLEKNSSHKLQYCIYEAEKIKKHVSDIQSGVDENSVEIETLASIINELIYKETQINDYLNEMKLLAQQLPLYHQLQTIPGIAENIAVRLVSELGDLSRFDNKRQLVAYAGIDPRVYQSGQMTGDHLNITKKGNKHLRTLLYLAVSGNIRSTKDNSISEFYYKKRQQTNPLSHKAALIACANKLLRIIFSMNLNGSNFLI